MIWVVLDTNVLLKGLFSHINPSRRIINLAMEGKIVIAGSATSMEEFDEKLQMEKFKPFFEKQKFSPKLLLNTYQNVVTLTDIDDGLKALSVCRDSDDDEFIRIALQKKSNIIVSEDKDLLDLGKYQEVRIIKPKKFIEIYDKIKR